MLLEAVGCRRATPLSLQGRAVAIDIFLISGAIGRPPAGSLNSWRPKACDLSAD